MELIYVQVIIVLHPLSLVVVVKHKPHYHPRAIEVLIYFINHTCLRHIYTYCHLEWFQLLNYRYGSFNLPTNNYLLPCTIITIIMLRTLLQQVIK